jgi:hypothetical protein
MEENFIDSVFLVVLGSVEDPEVEFYTFVRGSNELARFLLHYNTDLYFFIGAEAFCQGNRLILDTKEFLNKVPKKEKNCD